MCIWDTSFFLFWGRGLIRLQPTPLNGFLRKKYFKGRRSGQQNAFWSFGHLGVTANKHHT